MKVKPETQIGNRFNRLTLIELAGIRNRKTFGTFKCDCGSVVVSEASAVLCGRTKSCGCLAKETARKTGIANKRHGLTKTVEHATWVKMTQRCTNKNDKSYKHYGARGVSVCSRWLTFENFYADMGPRPGDNYSIERLNVNGNYEPDNCVWANAQTQARNTTKTPRVDVDGEQIPIRDFIDEFGIKRETLKSRLLRGCEIGEALLTPVREIKSTRRLVEFEAFGKAQTLIRWAEEYAIPYKTLLYRFSRCDDLEKCLTKPVRKTNK